MGLFFHNMMPIYIKSVPHGVCRNDGVGDYWYDNEETHEIRVSNMDNEDAEFLVAVHELIESYLCRKRGVSEASITDFDAKFENMRIENSDIVGKQEPGSMMTAPYHREHVFAEKIERLVAEEIGLSWEEYENLMP